MGLGGFDSRFFDYYNYPNFESSTFSSTTFPTKLQSLIPFITSPLLSMILFVLGLGSHDFVLGLYPKRPHTVGRWILMNYDLYFPKVMQKLHIIFCFALSFLVDLWTHTALVQGISIVISKTFIISILQLSINCFSLICTFVFFFVLFYFAS